MTIEITLRDAIVIVSGVTEFPALPGTAVRASYWLGRYKDYLIGHVQQYEKDRNNLVKEYGELQKETQSYLVHPDKMEAYNIANDDLLSIKIEIPYKQIELKDIIGSNPDKAPELKPEVLYRCMKIIHSEN